MSTHTVCFMTNRFSSVCELLMTTAQISLVGLIYVPLPDDRDEALLQAAQHNHIPCFSSVHDFLTHSDQRPEILAVYSLHKILKLEEFGMSTLASINLHPSLLPSYKGKNPWHEQFRDHVTHGGFTVHTITPEIDGGKILMQDTFPMDYSLPKQAIIEHALRTTGAPLLLRAIQNIEKLL